jgi:UDP:flavonoid glycosyltransferase YjiC (YdhE family)
VLEAIFCGVPQLLIPPTSFHRVVADRVAELGLGKTISSSGLCADELITQVSETMKDREIRQRVADAQLMMRRDGGAVLAVDIIEEYLSGRA